jgi:hypothetical protein
MCLIALATFISARLAIFLTWIFQNERMTAAMPSGLVGVLGFLFLPWTTLAYTWCYAYTPGVSANAGVTGIGWFIVILAFLVDLGSYGSSDRYRRQRYA